MTQQGPLPGGGDVAELLALADRGRESPEDDGAAGLLARPHPSS